MIFIIFSKFIFGMLITGIEKYYDYYCF